MRAIPIGDGETDPATDDLAWAICELAAVAPALPPTASLLPSRLAPA